MKTAWFVYHSPKKGVRATAKRLPPSQMRYDEYLLAVVEGVSRKTALVRGAELVKAKAGQAAA